MKKIWSDIVIEELCVGMTLGGGNNSTTEAEVRSNPRNIVPKQYLSNSGKNAVIVDEAGFTAWLATQTFAS